MNQTPEKKKTIRYVGLNVALFYPSTHFLSPKNSVLHSGQVATSSQR